MKYTYTGAELSPDGRHRYLLWREWRGTHDPKNWRWYGAKDGAGQKLSDPKACLFIMLNPSTADADDDDPTVKRCVAFAQAWKYERLEVVNLFAYRATDPQELLRLGHGDDPVGERNQHFIASAANDAGIIICAWGQHGSHLGQDATVLGWLDKIGATGRAHALGFTTKGQPRHPLYVPSAVQPISWGR